MTNFQSIYILRSSASEENDKGSIIFATTSLDIATKWKNSTVPDRSLYRSYEETDIRSDAEILDWIETV